MLSLVTTRTRIKRLRAYPKMEDAKMNVKWKDLSQGEKLQFIAGCLLVVYVFWKGFIVGYYPSELIPLGCAALLGFILLSRLKRSVQMREKLEQQRLDSEKGIE